jgi:chorismate-pyruvate lyase
MALGVVIPMSVLITVFMSCRLYCRTVLVKTLGWDDGFMLVAAVSLIELHRYGWRTNTSR